MFQVSDNGQMKQVFVIGVRDEIMPVSFVEMGWETQWIIEKLHIIAYNELIHRNILTVFDWSLRTKNIFLHNNIRAIGHVICAELRYINNLVGCGFKSRREIYEVFNYELGIKLNQWNPDLYMDKFQFNKGVGEVEEVEE